VLKNHTKNHIIPIRLSDVEYEGICKAAEELGISKSEVFRRLYWTVRVLFSDKLKLKNALIEQTHPEEPLSYALRNIQELMDEILDR